MNRNFLFIIGMILPGMAMAQPGGPGPDYGSRFAENWSTVAAGGGRFFFALLAGVLLAYAFQWILTSLSFALGISALGRGSHKKQLGGLRSSGRFEEEDYEEDAEERAERMRREERREKDRREKEAKGETGWESSVVKVESGVGIWALLTTAISVFFASWLATELIRFGNRSEAVILGLTVWAGFLLSMLWMEAATLGTLFGSIVNAFKGGAQAVLAPVKSAAGSLADKAAASADEIAAKVREEFDSQGGAEGLKGKLKDYMGQLKPRTLDRHEIETEADHIFDDSEIREAARKGNLQTIDRNRFREIVESRGDIPREERDQWAEVLETRYGKLLQEGRGSEASWQPSLDVDETTPVNASGPTVVSVPTGESSARPSGTTSSGMAPIAASTGAGTVRSVANQAFISRFQGFKEFLRSAAKQELNPSRLEQEVETVVIHPEEGYARMERSVREMNREEMLQALRQRKDISGQEADGLADLIDAARSRMLSRSEMREHRAQEDTDKALSRIRDRIYSLKRPEIDYDSFKGDFAKMLEDPKGGLESLKSKVTGLDRNALIDTFAAKKGISRQEAEKMADQAEQAMKTAQEKGQKIQEETRRRMEAIKRASLAQAEGARKAASTAAWWLFAIAVVTAAAAALGGLTGANT